jgi:hypothetical protein
MSDEQGQPGAPSVPTEAPASPEGDRGESSSLPTGAPQEALAPPSDDLWGELVDYEEPTAPSAPAAQPPASEAQPQAPQVPPAQPQAPASPAPQAQPAAPQAPAVPPAAEVPQAPAAPQVPQEAQPPARLTEDQLKEARTSWIGQLATSYALSEEDVQAFESEPEKVLPRFAARLHAKAVEDAVTHALARVPEMVQAQITQLRSGWQREATFYRQWPQLRNPQYANTVAILARTYAQVHPQATLEEFTRNVGAQAMVALGLPTDGAQPSQGAPAPTPQAVQHGFQQGFQPVAPGAGTGSPSGGAAAPSNEFTELYEDIKEHGWH